MPGLFTDKTLLITGGTGSFGHAVVDRLLKTDIKEIRILSRDEKKQDDMRQLYASSKLRFCIGDIRDLHAILPFFRGVDFVFAAAALKQVPSCEFYPMEAVKTNVLGNDNVISACFANHVKKAVFLSTDKAAYPIDAMGMTKALMEKVVIARAREMREGDPVFCLTRYGNVMGTRGSVIPLFLEQIAAGKPITITNPDMTRFMMTLDDAVDLVILAFERADAGDIFVKKAPAATIGTLAQAILSLKRSDSGIEYIGARHGEKLFETLITGEEMPRAIDEGGFYRIPADNRDLNYAKRVSPEDAVADYGQSYTSHNAPRLSLEDMKRELLRIDAFKNAR